MVIWWQNLEGFIPRSMLPRLIMEDGDCSRLGAVIFYRSRSGNTWSAAIPGANPSDGVWGIPCRAREDIVVLDRDLKPLSCTWEKVHEGEVLLAVKEESPRPLWWVGVPTELQGRTIDLFPIISRWVKVEGRAIEWVLTPPTMG